MLIDSHCHLDLPQFEDDRLAVIARAHEVQVDLMVNPGIDLHHSRRAIQLAQEIPALYAAVGIHPNSAASVDESDIETLRSLAGQPKVVAVGEIGLDYYWDKTPVDQQKWVFRKQLGLAADLGLPVVIHSREANDDVAAILSEWVTSADFAQSPLASFRKSGRFVGVLHAFSGDLDLAEMAYGWNFVLSLGGPVTFKNARLLHSLAPQLRLDRLMLETDAPYLTPHPFRGQRNEPAYVALVRDRLAQLLGVDPQHVADVTTDVAVRFFGLEDKGFAGNAAPHQDIQAQT